MVILIVLGVIILAGIVFLAVSPKSSRTIKFVALGALALMVLAVVISFLFIFGLIRVGGPQEPLLPDMDIFEAPEVPRPNYMALIMFSVFLIVLFILVVVLAFREKRSAKDKNDW